MYLFCVCVRVCVSLGRFEFGVPVGRVVPDVLCYVVLCVILDSISVLRVALCCGALRCDVM